MEAGFGSLPVFNTVVRRIFAGAADRLEPLAGDDNALRFLAREGLALGAWKAGNTDDARRWIAGILDQEGAPSE